MSIPTQQSDRLSHTPAGRRLDAPPLNALLGERFILGPVHLLLAGWFAAFFLYYSYMPLFHSDIWGHVSYGHWILEHGQLPAEDPFVGLAEGVSVTDTAWLGQVIFAAGERAAGAEAVSHIFAVTVMLGMLVLARVFYLQTRSIPLALLGTWLVWIIAWSRHAVVRPEIFGSLCFAILWWLIVRADNAEQDIHDTPTTSNRPKPWGMWIGVPLVFAAWANLHGSFVVGLCVLGCCLLGRAIEVGYRSQSPLAILADGRFRRWLVINELAVAATLLNPYGVDLLIHTSLFPSNPNLNDVLEWFRLEMVSYEGIQIGFSWLVMLVVLRHSRAPMKPRDVLLAAVFTLAVCLRVRMATWYAPVAVVVLMPHIADVAAQVRQSVRWPWTARLTSRLSTRSHHYTLVAGLLMWVAFAFSPLGTLVLGGKPRPVHQLHGRATPLELTEFLREHPPAGQIANPQWWGDWLVWDGPPELQVFMTTNAVHVAPRQVWKDYLAIARAQPGLERRLDRYRVNTIVAHKELQRRLTSTVRDLEGWETVYEDELAIVAARAGTFPDRVDRPTDDGVVSALVPVTGVVH